MVGHAPYGPGAPGAAEAIALAAVDAAAASALAPLAALRGRIGDRPAGDGEIASAYGAAFQSARRAVDALARIDLHHLDIPALARFCAGSGEARAKAPKLRASVPADALPGQIAEHLATLRSATRGEFFEKDGSVATGMFERALRQLCHSAGEAGVEPGFSPAAIHAYIAAMLRRGVGPSTIHSRLCTLGHFAKLFELPYPFSRERAFWWARSKRQTKRSERVMERLALTRETYRDAAGAMLQRAAEATSAASAVRAFNAAGMFAMVSEDPARRTDMVGLVVGVSIRRDTSCWTLDFLQSKTGARHFSGLDPRVTPYLDAVILRGAPPEWFADLYRRAAGRAFFAGLDGAPLKPAAVTCAFRSRFSTGSHIARNVAYLEEAEAPGGLTEAARRNGHANADMAATYMPRVGWVRCRTAAHRRHRAVLRRRGFLERRAR